MDRPNYMKIDRATWDAVRSLPRAQGAKLVYSLLALFMDGEDAADLPERARTLYALKEKDVRGYRRRVLNGMKRRPALSSDHVETDSKPKQNRSKTDSGNDSVSEYGIIAGFEVHTEHLPAQTQNLGTYLEPNPTADQNGNRYIYKEYKEDKEEIDIRTSDVAEPARAAFLGCLAMEQEPRTVVKPGGFPGETMETTPCYLDVERNPHKTALGAIEASYTALTGRDPRGYVEKIAAACPNGCSADDDSRESCYQCIMRALQRFNPSKARDPWQITRMILAQDRRTA